MRRRSSCLALLLPGLLMACTGDGPDGPDTDVDTDVEGAEPLQDLALTVTPQGATDDTPYGDGSGIVELRATATGAERFEVVLNGGEPIDSPTGEEILTVDHEGAALVSIDVTAFTSDGASATVTEALTVLRATGPFSTLVWADEFSGSGSPSTDRWKPQTQPPLDGGWFNGEQQHYTGRLSNAEVSDGTLKITALRESYTVEGSERSFTSARLNSTFPFTYGRVEVRAKLPIQAGTWPAIWTLGANINELGNPFGDTYGDVGWPACGEIDILEQTGWDKASTIAHFHWGDTQSGAYHNEGGSIANPDATEAFHVYALEWDEEDLSIYVDDQLVHSMPNDVGRPYDNPHYILLNVAMGGNLGGEIPGDFDRAVMEVDYVRIYQ